MARKFIVPESLHGKSSTTVANLIQRWREDEGGNDIENAFALLNLIEPWLRGRFKELPNRYQAIAEMYQQGFSEEAVAEKFGVSRGSVSYALRKLGIPRRRPGRGSGLYKFNHETAEQYADRVMRDVTDD